MTDTTTTHEPELVTPPARTCLMVDGRNGPDGPEFRAAVAALYALADGTLEGLWDSGESATFDLADPAGWRWTLLLPAPDGVAPPAGGPVRAERFDEGPCAQILHVGPYEAEAPTIARLEAWMAEHGRRPAGRHHEIYLDDPRTTDPARLRTLIRQPVAPA